MSVEPIDYREGISRARIVCDDCGKDEVVPCAYVRERNRSQPTPNVSMARARALAMGWAFVKGTLRCPTCESKRKVVPMTKPKLEAPKEPTRAQKREIMDLLGTVYDSDAERYKQGDTDDSVAGVLGVMPGWVAQLREEFFGPAAGNADMDDLLAKLEAMEGEMKGIAGDCRSIIADCDAFKQAATAAMKSNERKLAEVATLKTDLEKIRKAVGARTVKKAGVA